MIEFESTCQINMIPGKQHFQSLHEQFCGFLFVNAPLNASTVFISFILLRNRSKILDRICRFISLVDGI